MSLAGLLPILDDDAQLREVVARAQAGPASAGQMPAGQDLVAPAALRPVLAAVLAAGAPSDAQAGDAQAGDAQAGDGQAGDARQPGTRGFVLAVTATAREADDLVAALGSFLPPDTAAGFPGWETLPHERLSPRSDTVGQRIAVLRRLAHPAAPGEPNGPLSVVVTPVRSLLQPMVGGLGDLEPVTLQAGQACELDDLLTRLVEIGYARTDMVGSRGEIAVRGGIVDVFPPTEEHPLRVEFFGDTIEEIRYFRVADQRSIGPDPQSGRGLWAPPCRELLLTPTVRARAKELADTHPALADTLGKLSEGITVEGMEAFAPVLADRMELLLDYVPAGGIVLACDPERIRARAGELVRTSQEFLEASWVNAAAGGEAPVDLGPAAFQPIERIRASAADLGLPWWTVAPFGVTEEDEAEPGAGPAPAAQPDRPGEPAPFRINATLAPSYRGDTTRMLTDVRSWLAERLAGRAGHRGARAGPAAGRDAPRRGDRRPPAGRRCAARGRRPLRDHRVPRQRLCLAGRPAGRAHRERPGRAPGRPADDQGHAADAEPAARRRRPAAAQGGRLRGARAARRRPVRRDDLADRGRSDPGVPGHRVRAGPAGPAAGPAVRADRPAGRGDQVHRRRGAGPAPPGRGGLGQGQGPGAQGRPADRLRADPAVLGPDGLARVRVRPGHALAARARGRLPLRGDAGPAGRHRRGQARHGACGADGPADQRGRRLRQDRDRGPRRVQGGPGRQAGRGARADHAAGPAALLHVLRALRAVPGERAAAVALPGQGRDGRDPARPGRRHGGRGHRHAQAALPGDQVRPARPGHHRRGAAVRRRAQGVPQAAAHRGGRARHVGHADPADAGDGRGRDQGDVHHLDPARGAAPGAHLRRRLRREAGGRGHPARAAPGRPGLLRAQPGQLDPQGRGPARRARPGGAGSPSRTGR